MKKTVQLASLAVLALGTSLQAAEAGKWYLKADAGVALQQDVALKGLSTSITLDAPETLSAGELEDFLSELGLGDLVGELESGTTLPAGTYSVGKPKVSWNAGFRMDLAVGYSLTDNLAIELESGLLYNTADKIRIRWSLPPGVVIDGEAIESGSVKVKAKDLWGDDLIMWQIPVLANVVYKFPLESKFKPYVGAGLGGVYTLLDTPDDNESDFTFAYQVMAGGVFELSEKTEVGVGYKLLGSTEHKFGGVKTDATLSHSIVASFTFKF